MGAGKKTFEETLKLIGKYFAPVGGAIVGFFAAGPKLGGGYILADLIYGGMQKTNQAGKLQNNGGNISGFLGCEIFGAVMLGGGVALWHATRKSGHLGTILGGFFGGFFAGWGSYFILTGIGAGQGTPVSKGWIDTALTQLGG